MNYELTLKVCGMRDAENIRAVESLGIQWMGFIFWPGSKRFVSERPAYLPTKCKRVGVFVDADLTDVLQKVEEYALDLIQLHGSESPDYIRQLKHLLTAHPSPSLSIVHCPLSIIKAFNIATPADLEQTHAYENIVDYFLFDAKGKSVGGNGKQFDWQVLDHYHGHTPYLLSGGIGPDDADRVKEFITSSLPHSLTPSLHHSLTPSLHHSLTSSLPHSLTSSLPLCLGFDLNSRFETSPAVKDVESLRRFLTQSTH